MSGLKEKKGWPYSRQHTYRLIRDGKFPKPIKLGENRIAFSEDEVDACIKARMAERDSEAAQ
jgi:prophage regulatory protein